MLYRCARQWRRVAAARQTTTQAAAEAASQRRSEDSAGLGALLTPAAGNLLQQLLLCPSSPVWLHTRLSYPDSLACMHGPAKCSSAAHSASSMKPSLAGWLIRACVAV